MADPNTRQGKRTPVTLKIKFKSETLEQFIERYAVDVSQGGIFIRTKEPLAVGTQMKFEFQLRDASPLIAGEGTVVWTRENDPSRPAIAPGMGVRFDRLADGSQTVLERILSEKAKQAPARGAGNEATTKPPMFTDTPTRVAPAPVQEALGVRGKRKREDSEQTPLPKPMPFHSDAEDFDERAFEEATKVRSLEELAAASAGLAGESAEPESDRAKTTEMPSDTAAAAAAMPPDELAARRQVTKPESTDTEAATEPAAEEAAPVAKASGMIDRDSAPGLPEPPEASRPAKVLDTTPSPRAEKRPSVPPEDKSTKPGVEPAKAPTAESPVPRAVASEPSQPIAPKRPSSAPIVIGILVVVAAAIGAVWWFVLREDVAKKNDQVVDNSGSGSAGSAAQNDLGSGSGSAVAQSDIGSGSARADVDSGSAAAPVGPVVDTVIASSVTKGATVEILGTDQKGPAPFTAKLEKDRAYTARVSAPGFQPQELDIMGGQQKTTVKLKAKTHVISVTSEPAGADIIIDGVNTQKITPADVELTATQAARSRVRVTLRRPGYRQFDQVLDAAKFVEAGETMTAKVDTKMVVQQIARPPTGNGAGSATTNGSGGGSATPAGSGADADGATPSGTTPSDGTAGSGGTTAPSGTTPSGTTPSAGSASGTGGSATGASTEAAEPEPSWTNPN